MRLRPTWVEIDVSALAQNLIWLKALNGDAFFCPMVKANAYGHGDVLVAKTAEKLGADAVGVALIEEGIRLREQGVRLPILVFAAFDTNNASYLYRHRLTPVLGRPADLEALAGAPPDFAVHLKMNTGMQRLGFDESDLPRLRADLGRLKLKVTGVCTHFTHGEDGATPTSPSGVQLERFQQMSEGLGGARHANKSASLLNLNEQIGAADGAKRIGARPGIALFGIPPGAKALDAHLRPVLSWRTQITHVHKIKANATVGYDGAWRADRDTILGVVPVGYADGFTRAMGAKQGQMEWRGERVAVVGRVCMDYTFLDLTDVVARSAAAATGEPVTIIGPNITAAERAGAVGTIPYELVTGISARVPREAV